MTDEKTQSRSRWLEWFAEGVPAGRLFGVEIRLHLLLAIPLLYFWAELRDGGAPLGARLFVWVVFSVALFGSVLAHELGHCRGARRVGGEARRILLWPLGGLALVGGVEKGPRQEFVVTILGPAVNVALALLFAALAYAMPASWSDARWSAAMARDLNAMLAGFNLLMPLFPLDGARLLRSIGSMRWDPNRVTFGLATFGMAFGSVLFLASLFHMTGNWGGGALGLIGLLGAFESMRERQRSLAESVYEEGPWNWASAPWGGEAKARTPPIWMELRRALIEAFGPSGRTADRAARGRRAKVIDASGREAQREALRRELDQAVAQEDFARAARLRDRLRDLDSR